MNDRITTPYHRPGCFVVQLIRSFKRITQKGMGLLDKAWVEMMFEKMGRIGKTEPGYTRLAYSEADWEAKRLIMDTMVEMGLQVRMDAVGNIVGRLAGSDPAAPVVAAGSHVDTVPEGGNFDGSVGVMVRCARFDACRRGGRRGILWKYGCLPATSPAGLGLPIWAAVPFAAWPIRKNGQR